MCGHSDSANKMLWQWLSSRVQVERMGNLGFLLKDLWRWLQDESSHSRTRFRPVRGQHGPGGAVRHKPVQIPEWHSLRPRLRAAAVDFDIAATDLCTDFG